MATEQTGNESLQEMVNENQPANTSMNTRGGFGGMVYEQYLKAKENAEAYPYVWSSYLIVYGGFGMWVAYRYRKLLKAEDRVRGLQERLRYIHKEREVPSSVEGRTLTNLPNSMQPCKRRLEETKGIPDPMKIAEVLLVRRILAWITGIIFFHCYTPRNSLPHEHVNHKGHPSVF